MMKAISVGEFGGPEVLRCKTVPIPEVGAGEVLVAVHAVGVNPVDTYIRSGTYAVKPALPYTPGTDAAGVVAVVGAGVTGVASGDRVYTAGTVSGAYADFALCKASQVHPLPANCSFAQGAALGTPTATAFRALFQKGRAQAGETLLVHGATGSVGLAAVQLALAAGLRVYATGGSEEGRALLTQLGVAAVFDHHSPDYVERLQQAGGINLVLEMLGNVNLERDLQLVARDGRIVIVGNRGRIEIDPRLIMQKEAVVTGVMLSAATPTELAEIHAGLNRYLVDGRLSPVVGQRFTLEEAALAHETVLKSHVGKVVLLTEVGNRDA